MYLFIRIQNAEEDNLEQEKTTSIGQRCARHALTNSTNLFLEGQNRPLFRRYV